MESEEECFRFGHVMKKQRKKERRRTSKGSWSVICLKKESESERLVVGTVWLRGTERKQKWRDINLRFILGFG